MLKHKTISDDIEWIINPTPGHVVQYYNSSMDLINPLGEYVFSAISKNEVCIIIATPEHTDELLAKLETDGLTISEAQSNGRLLLLDASETLSKFMVDGVPDRKQFFEVVGNLIGDKARKGDHIRAYGEMVAVLWKEGNDRAALMLEDLWNELSQQHRFSLYCAYSSVHLGISQQEKAKINNCHNVALLSL